MLTLKCSASGWALANDQEAVLYIGALSRYEESQNTEDLPNIRMNSRKTTMEDGWLHEMLRECEDPRTTNGIDLYLRGSIAVFSIGTTLLSHQPLFGEQLVMPPLNSVRLSLQIAGHGPFLALYQHKEWWMRPAFVQELAMIPARTQLVVQRAGDAYRVFLAVCGKNARADMNGTMDGLELTLSSNCSGCTELKDIAFAVAEGKDPYTAIEQAVAAALGLSDKPVRMRAQRRFPGVLEYLGWCTWDSLGKDVNSEAVFKKLDELRDKKVPVHWVLIDDGWSLVNRETEQLRDFTADPTHFPDGLGKAIKRIKEEYGIPAVGVWQAVLGYWNGVEEGSSAHVKAAPFLQRLSNGHLIPKAQADAAFGFWNVWHAYLRRQGVDFVKIDSQSTFSIVYRGIASYGEATQAIHTGMDASVALNFDGAAIQCMGMAPEDIWNRPMAAVSRSSDDFTPRIKGSFFEHAIQNGYNSILNGCFYWTDWDMFWTNHVEAQADAILHAISGGPVYISDGLGETEVSVLKPLLLDDGRILRCDDVGRPTLDCLLADPVKTGILKLFNRVGNIFVLAAFEPAGRIAGTLGSADIPALRGKKCWCFNWFTQKVSVLSPEERCPLNIMPNGTSLFLLAQYGEVITVIGLLNRYISPASCCILFGSAVETVLKSSGTGEFAFLTEHIVEKVVVNGTEVEFQKNGPLYRFVCVSAQSFIQISLYKKR